MNLFITGSNGYLAKNLINRLSKKKNIKIFALTRKKNNTLKKNVKWLVGPIDKEWPELKKSDILIHLAAEGVRGLYSNYKKCYNFNVTKSKKLVLNAYKSGCKKWLIVTSCKEKKIGSIKKYQNNLKKYEKIPFFNYGLTKKIFTEFCINFSKQKKVKCRIFRLFQIYGGNEPKKRLWPSLLEAIKGNKNLTISHGEQKQDFCNIRFLLDELEKSLNFSFKKKNFPQIWDLATGKSVSVKNFIKLFWKKFNSKKEILISNNKDYDNYDYYVNKKILWKVKSEI